MDKQWKTIFVLVPIVGIVSFLAGASLFQSAIAMMAIAALVRFEKKILPTRFTPKTKRGRYIVLAGSVISAPFILPALYLIFVFGALGVGFGVDAIFAEERDPELRSHMTIYVADPLLTEGGAVIVAAIPMPENEWRALDGENLADADPDNRKRPGLREGDRLFGVRATSTATIIEMFYPENGTFGFDLVPAREIQRPPELKTERILVGSGKRIYERDGNWFDWPDISTIYVSGKVNDASYARIISSSTSDLMFQKPSETFFAGANVYSPTPEQIKKASRPGSL